jgi:hypothetical protein
VSRQSVSRYHGCPTPPSDLPSFLAEAYHIRYCFAKTKRTPSEECCRSATCQPRWSPNALSSCGALSRRCSPRRSPTARTGTRHSASSRVAPSRQNPTAAMRLTEPIMVPIAYPFASGMFTPRVCAVDPALAVLFLNKEGAGRTLLGRRATLDHRLGFGENLSHCLWHSGRAIFMDVHTAEFGDRVETAQHNVTAEPARTVESCDKCSRHTPPLQI